MVFPSAARMRCWQNFAKAMNSAEAVAWVVDTSVLLDIRQNDPQFGPSAARCLVRYLPEGLVLCPVTYIELAPEFAGDSVLQEEFLQRVGVRWFEPWTRKDTENAFVLWAEHVAKKRSGHAGKRPVADVLIEAFARRFQGLITRNPRHFSTIAVVAP
jgi:predicted nucleic acid-binding protein